MPRRVKKAPAVRALRIWLEITDGKQMTPYVAVPVNPLTLSASEKKAYRLIKYAEGRRSAAYLCRQTTHGLRCTCQAGYFRRQCKHLAALVAAGMFNEE